MDLSSPATLFVLVLIGAMLYCFFHAASAVLGHRVSTQIRKHDTIAAARHKRNEYLQAVADRAAQVAGHQMDEDDFDPSMYNVEIVDDEPLAA